MTPEKSFHDEFSQYAGPVARALLGEPNTSLSKDTELRFRNRGSMAVDLTKGAWHDHENGQGGGVLDLIVYQGEADTKAQAVKWLDAQGFRQSNDSNTLAVRPRIVATYDYTDADGVVLFQVCRFEPKAFKQRRPDASARGGWTWSVKGVQQVPYRLPQLLAAPDAPVFVVEGEKDADNLAAIGLTATCNAGGAGKWPDALAQHFAGRHVVIMPDNDDAGREHARVVAAKLRSVAADLRVLELPGLPIKGDVSDWLENGGTAADILTLAKAASAPPALLDDLPVIDVHKLSEDALATVFEHRHAHALRYCHTSGNWFAWTGTRWQRETTSLAFNWARVICRDFGNGEAKFAKAATASAVERFAAAARCFAVTAEVWDRAPWLIGTPGGTLDLRSGNVRTADPGDHITRQSGAALAPADAVPARWLSFLEDATRGDAELVRFLQQVAGYALTGDTSEHALFFIYGAGGNGKSVFLNTLSGILGEYATTAPMDTFTASQHDKHPTDLAMLKGARLVTASETEDGRAWAEAKIKQMTGGDPVTARFMRQDFFTFRPEFKLVIVGNHKPRLNNVDDATRRRLNIIPFIHKPTTPDPDLERALRDEWPAIFRWMVDGCLDWQANGLVRPSVVIDATREYFEDQDVFGQWLIEGCERETRFKETNVVLFASWKRYAEAAGEHAGSAKAFGEAMRKRGLEPYKSGGARGFLGVRLVPSAVVNDPRFAKDWD